MWCSSFLHRRSAGIIIAVIALFLSTAAPAEAQTPITSAAIIEATNSERRSDGERALTSDASLARIAQTRLKDMFTRQYFSHKGPTGQTVSKLAIADDYEYVVIGENLALGSYANAADMVDAWMESPGHKENILQDEYTAIGVAVGSGTFEGKETLIAVQVFAKPLSQCEKPSTELKDLILAEQGYIQRVRSLVSSYVRSGVSIPRTLNNQIASLLAVFTEDLNSKVAQYNKQVKAYESCTRG